MRRRHSSQVKISAETTVFGSRTSKITGLLCSKNIVTNELQNPPAGLQLKERFATERQTHPPDCNHRNANHVRDFAPLGAMLRLVKAKMLSNAVARCKFRFCWCDCIHRNIIAQKLEPASTSSPVSKFTCYSKLI